MWRLRTHRWTWSYLRLCIPDAPRSAYGGAASGTARSCETHFKYFILLLLLGRRTFSLGWFSCINYAENMQQSLLLHPLWFWISEPVSESVTIPFELPFCFFSLKKLDEYLYKYMLKFHVSDMPTNYVLAKAPTVNSLNFLIFPCISSGFAGETATKSRLSWNGVLLLVKSWNFVVNTIDNFFWLFSCPKNLERIKLPTQGTRCVALNFFSVRRSKQGSVKR